MEVNEAQRARIEEGDGFIAALDQSGGSTPKALSLYGVMPEDYDGDAEMFEAMHAMRSRIILAEDFTSDRIIGAILFERTMDSEIEGKPTAQLLWEDRGIVPFLKIDKGLADRTDDVQMLKPMPELDGLLTRAREKGIFGTKERSVIHAANAEGIERVVAQQFDVARQVCAAGLVPIIEPEVDINAPDKAAAEELLAKSLMRHVEQLNPEQLVMLKLTLPEEPGLYDALAGHENVLRVVALSGGYSTDEACRRLAQNGSMVASFSRALTEGLDVKMTDAEFNAALGANIGQIYEASVA